MVLGVYGSGGAGKEIKEIAIELNKWDEVLFIDDIVSGDIFKGVRRMPFPEFREEFNGRNAEVLIAQGEPQDKIALYHKVKDAGFGLANVIHRTAWISPSATIGMGVMLRAGVVINADAVIGDNVTVQEYSCVGHDTIIGDHCQIADGVMMGGHVEIGMGTYIGLSASIRDRVKIGSHSVIGMGSVVVYDIPDYVAAMGNPARITKSWEDESRVFK